MAAMTYCIDFIEFGDSRIYLSESPEEFVLMVDTVFLNTSLITGEDLDNLVGYLAVSYPNVTLESQRGATGFLKYVEVPEYDQPKIRRSIINDGD